VTNIYSDSDVDVVVQLSETFTYDLTRLTEPTRGRKQRELDTLGPAAYSWDNFRRDVLESLRRHYGAANVLEGNKALKLSPGNGRLAADVVPAIVHKLYRRTGVTLATLLMSPDHFEGIAFWDRAGRRVTNYPKEHIKNGQAKNGAGRTDGNYKPVVRMFKNARRYHHWGDSRRRRRSAYLELRVSEPAQSARCSDNASPSRYGSARARR